MYRQDGEQEELNISVARVVTKIISQVKGRKRKEIGRTIEHRIKSESGTRRILVRIEKGKVVDRQFFDGEMLNKVDYTYVTKKEKKALIKKLKAFINKNSNVRLTEFGLRRLILDDTMEVIPDEEIL